MPRIGWSRDLPNDPLRRVGSFRTPLVGPRCTTNFNYTTTVGPRAGDHYEADGSCFIAAPTQVFSRHNVNVGMGRGTTRSTAAWSRITIRLFLSKGEARMESSLSQWDGSLQDVIGKESHLKVRSSGLGLDVDAKDSAGSPALGEWKERRGEGYFIHEAVKLGTIDGPGIIRPPPDGGRGENYFVDKDLHTTSTANSEAVTRSGKNHVDTTLSSQNGAQNSPLTLLFQPNLRGFARFYRDNPELRIIRRHFQTMPLGDFGERGVKGFPLDLCGSERVGKTSASGSEDGVDHSTPGEHPCVPLPAVVQGWLGGRIPNRLDVHCAAPAEEFCDAAFVAESCASRIPKLILTAWELGIRWVGFSRELCAAERCRQLSIGEWSIGGTSSPVIFDSEGACQFEMVSL